MDESILKKCLGCGKAKAPAEFYGNGRGGLMSRCKACFLAEQQRKRDARPAKPRKSPEQKFWERVDKSGPIPEHVPELGPCWVWTACRTAAGYGVVGISREKIYAHRLSWRLAHGDAGGMCVLHRCDNRARVNPAHLFLGSKLDNTADMMAKRRGRVPEHRGAECYQAKLSDETALDALRQYADGVSQTEIARRHGVTIQAIHQLVKRKTWRHLQWP